MLFADLITRNKQTCILGFRANLVVVLQSCFQHREVRSWVMAWGENKTSEVESETQNTSGGRECLGSKEKWEAQSLFRCGFLSCDYSHPPRAKSFLCFYSSYVNQKFQRFPGRSTVCCSFWKLLGKEGRWHMQGSRP